MAAGLGFKDFTTGEVLTAADVDGYLMQGIWVFASAAARDAAVTSPQEGNFAFLKDTNTTTYYTGSAWTNLDTTGMVNPMTTTGDTIYSSSGSTPARLGIGSTGQVLTVSGGVPSWATPSGGTLDLAQISTGSLSGGAVNLTSLTQDFFLLYITGVNFIPSIRLNNNSGSVYSARTLRVTSSFDSWNGNDRWDLGTTAYSGTSNEWYITIQNGKANGMHTVNYWGYYNSSSAAFGGGYFTNETAITQINIIANGGSFSAGTYTLIGG